MMHLFTSNSDFNACIPVQGITVVYFYFYLKNEGFFLMKIPEKVIKHLKLLVYMVIPFGFL